MAEGEKNLFVTFRFIFTTSRAGVNEPFRARFQTCISNSFFQGRRLTDKSHTTSDAANTASTFTCKRLYVQVPICRPTANGRGQWREIKEINIHLHTVDQQVVSNFLHNHVHYFNVQHTP